MITAGESPRAPYQTYSEWFNNQDRAHLIAKSRDAENIFRKTGITFAVYGHEDSSEKLIPFDIIRASSPAVNGESSRRASNSASSH